MAKFSAEHHKLYTLCVCVILLLISCMYLTKIIGNFIVCFSLLKFCNYSVSYINDILWPEHGLWRIINNNNTNYKTALPCHVFSSSSSSLSYKKEKEKVASGSGRSSPKRIPGKTVLGK